MQTAKIETERVIIDPLWHKELPDRPYNPYESMRTMIAWKVMPEGKLWQYFNTRHDIIARWLERKGMHLDTPCRAYVSGQNKMLRVEGYDYLTCIDGLIYIQKIDKNTDFND